MDTLEELMKQKEDIEKQIREIKEKHKQESVGGVFIEPEQRYTGGLGKKSIVGHRLSVVGKLYENKIRKMGIFISNDKDEVIRFIDTLINNLNNLKSEINSVEQEEQEE